MASKAKLRKQANEQSRIQKKYNNSYLGLGLTPREKQYVKKHNLQHSPGKNVSNMGFTKGKRDSIKAKKENLNAPRTIAVGGYFYNAAQLKDIKKNFPKGINPYMISDYSKGNWSVSESPIKNLSESDLVPDFDYNDEHGSGNAVVSQKVTFNKRPTPTDMVHALTGTDAANMGSEFDVRDIIYHLQREGLHTQKGAKKANVKDIVVTSHASVPGSRDGYTYSWSEGEGSYRGRQYNTEWYDPEYNFDETELTDNEIRVVQNKK